MHLLKLKSFDHLSQLVDIVIENIFKKHFTLFGGLGPKSRSSLIFQATTLNLKFWFFTLKSVYQK